MEVVSEVSKSTELRHGNTVVGTIPVPVGLAFQCARGVMIRADDANTAAVYVGGRNVKADSSESGGMPIYPAASLFLPVDDPSQCFVVSIAENQRVAWMGV
jgi:hypothetical protein